jgi:hypothetical protein
MPLIWVNLRKAWGDRIVLFCRSSGAPGDSRDFEPAGMAFAVAEPHWFPSVGWRKRAGFYIRPFLSRPLSAAAGSRVHTPAGVNRITSARVDKITTGIVHLAVLTLFDFFFSLFFFLLVHNFTSLAWESGDLPFIFNYIQPFEFPAELRRLLNPTSEIISEIHGTGAPCFTLC